MLVDASAVPWAVVSDALAATARRADDPHIAMIRAAGVLEVVGPQEEQPDEVTVRAAALSDSGRTTGSAGAGHYCPRSLQLLLTFEVVLPDPAELINHRPQPDPRPLSIDDEAMDDVPTRVKTSSAGLAPRPPQPK